MEKAWFGRRASTSIVLAGVESVAEGHSMNLCNNVILMYCSWRFAMCEQAINRAHRLNSQWPVNVYPVICDGKIDRKLEKMIQEKGAASELVLDGHLLGDHASEVNLAELLNIDRAEFNSGRDAVSTVDESELVKEWPQLRADLATLSQQWSRSTQAVSDMETVAPHFEPQNKSVERNKPTVKDAQLELKPAARDRKPVPLWRLRRSATTIPPLTVVINCPRYKFGNF